MGRVVSYADKLVGKDFEKGLARLQVPRSAERDLRLDDGPGVACR